MASRAIAAGKCSSGLGMTMPILLDTMKNPAYAAYKGFPAGTHIIDLDGKIQYATRGPWGTTPKGAEVVLKKLLAALPKTPEEVIAQFAAELETLGKTYPELANFKAREQNRIAIHFGERATGVWFSFFTRGEKEHFPHGISAQCTPLKYSQLVVWVMLTVPKDATKGLKEKLEALITKYTQRLVVLDQQAAAKKAAEAKKTPAAATTK